MPETVSAVIHQTAQKAVDVLRAKTLTVSTAESCTAGLLSAAITEVAGASAVFGCGIAAYSPAIKQQLLEVPAAILEAHGTVSSETATAMADGVRRKSGADIGVAITGVAGPAPSEGKPVGTVHIALADKHRVWLTKLPEQEGAQTRDNIRNAAVLTALSMVLQYAENFPLMMAGSVPIIHTEKTQVVIPEQPATHQRKPFLATILPWQGDSLKERLYKAGGIFAALCVFAGILSGGYQLFSESGNRSLYSDLQNIYTTEQVQTQTPSDPKTILPRFSSLALQNADIGGWIRIADSGINYPVMKNAGSNFYADHNFRQQASTYGVPFFDKDNHLASADEQDKVLVIYGNNTGDGQMFSDLLSYREPTFFKKHAVVEMSTLYAAEHWELFAVMVIDPQEVNAFPFNQTVFEDQKTFTDHIAAIRKRSLLNTNVTVNADDRLLVLVTQAEKVYGFDGATFVVVGKRLTQSDTASEKETLSVTKNQTVIMPRAWVRNQQHTVTKHTTTTKTQSTTTKTQSTTTTTRAETTTNLTSVTTDAQPSTTDSNTPTSDTIPTQVTTTVDTTVTQSQATTTTVPDLSDDT